MWGLVGGGGGGAAEMRGALDTEKKKNTHTSIGWLGCKGNEQMGEDQKEGSEHGGERGN